MVVVADGFVIVISSCGVVVVGIAVSAVAVVPSIENVIAKMDAAVMVVV